MFGIWGHEKAAEITYYGLHALQHRGQDVAGVVVSDGEQLKIHRDLGLVNDVFEHAEFPKLSGHAAIGHIRYGKKAEGGVDSVQPLLFHSQTDSLALAHSGNIMNAYELQGELESEGSILQTSSDTEVLAHLIKRNGKQTAEETIIDALQKIVGDYAFLRSEEDKMYVALDQRGMRPCSIGKLGNG